MRLKKIIRYIHFSICLLPLALTFSPAEAQNVSAQKAAQAKSLSKQGLELVQSNKTKEGARCFWEAASLNPYDPTIQYNLGAAYAELGQWREAWQSFERCTRLAPGDPRNWFGLAQAYANCGDKAKAIELLNATKKRFQTNASVQRSADNILRKLMSGSPLQTGSASSNSTLRRVQKLIGSNQFEESIGPLQSVVQSDPNNALAQHWLSLSLIKTGRFKEALAPSKAAVRLAPNEPGMLQNLMCVQTQIGDLEGLQESRKTFVGKFPNERMSDSIRDQIKYYQTDFAAIKEREQAGRATERNMSDAVYSRTDMPLKVFVHDRFKGRTTWSSQQSNKPSGINYSSLVEQAFSAWSAASAKSITFQFIDNQDFANIECQWTDDRSKLVHTFAAGVTQHTVNKEGKTKGVIFLLTMPESENFNSSVFFGVSLHEIGHALGLSHSSNPDDIMYFSETFKSSKNLPSLSAEDCRRIRTLYDGSR